MAETPDHCWRWVLLVSECCNLCSSALPPGLCKSPAQGGMSCSAAWCCSLCWYQLGQFALPQISRWLNNRGIDMLLSNTHHTLESFVSAGSKAPPWFRPKIKRCTTTLRLNLSWKTKLEKQILASKWAQKEIHSILRPAGCTDFVKARWYYCMYFKANVSLKLKRTPQKLHFGREKWVENIWCRKRLLSQSNYQ